MSPASQAVNAATLAGSALPPGLIAAYTFDEGTGTTTTDLSGNGKTGTLINGPVWSAGKYGNALSYNGVNSYVSLPNTLDIAAVPFTIAAWVKTTSGGELAIMYKGPKAGFGGANGGDGQQWLLRSGGTQLAIGGAGAGFMNCLRD